MTVGIIVNPHAGKDIRRLASAAGQTSDAVKIGIMHRAVVGALEQGAQRVLMSVDTHRLGEQAVQGLDGPIEFVESPLTGSGLDTTAAADAMCVEGAGAIIVLGGDGTCRDVAAGWPNAPMIAISTGTNNVFPSAIEGTSAGVAAALVATGTVPLKDVAQQAKLVVITTDDGASGQLNHMALVEAALIETNFVGARAVTEPESVVWVLASVADPASTGLASIAGRVHPVDRNDPGGVLIHLGPGGRQVRVPLSPGTFSTVAVRSVQPLPFSKPVTLPGGGVLAFDGERTVPAGSVTTMTASIEPDGPYMIDTRSTIVTATQAQCFDVKTTSRCVERKDNHGD